MKRIFLLLLIIIAVLSVSSCGKIAKGETGILEAAREELGTELEMQIVESADKNGKKLVWVITGNEYQQHQYFPIEFDVLKNDRYRLNRVHRQPIQRHSDIAAIEWMGGYSFIVNDPICRSICIFYENGESETVIVDEYPFVFETDALPASYFYQDSAGWDL